MPERRRRWIIVRRRDLIGTALATLAPMVPNSEREMILDHAEDSPGLRKATPAKAAWLSLVAFIRHNYSDYDSLLAEGYDSLSARHFSLEQINAVLQAWGCRRLVSGDEDTEVNRPPG
jgi:hypothetical protein